MISPLENGLPSSYPGTGTRNGDDTRTGLNGTSSRNGNTPDIQALMNDESFWSKFLGALGQTSGNLENSWFLQWLLSMGAQNLGSLGTFDDDMQQQLIKMFLDAQVKNEQRDYDKSVLSEQRSYDSPSSQLSRLMAAGIGRDAAIQMLSGGQDPALVGSGAESVSGMDLPSSTERLMQGINTGFSAIQTVGSLVSMGFSSAGAIHQIDMMKNSNSLTKTQLNAYNDASAAFSILNSAGASAESFGSVANAASEITKLAEQGNYDAQQFIANGSLERLKSHSYFTSPALSSMYRNERSSKDYDTSFGLFVDQQNADIDFRKADKSRVVQQTLNMEEEFKNLIASRDYTESQTALAAFHEDQLKAQTDLLYKQGKLAEAQILEEKARTNLLNSQTTAQDLENRSIEGMYNAEVDGKTGIEWLNLKNATSFYNDCQKFIACKDKRIWEKELNAIASDYDRLHYLHGMQLAWEKGAFNKYKTDPEFKDLIHVCTAMSECGAFDYLNVKLNGYRTFSNYDTPIGAKDLKKLIDSLP